jgi:hypothetical protein
VDYAANVSEGATCIDSCGQTGIGMENRGEGKMQNSNANTTIQKVFSHKKINQM